LNTGGDGAFYRRHIISVEPTGNKKTAAICWQHFKLYPSSAYYPSIITDPSAHVNKEWHKYAVCTHCCDRSSKIQDVTTSLLWDAKYGATHTTTHLTKHLRRKHVDLYKEAMLKKKVNDADS
jgi:hypothetical protein